MGLRLTGRHDSLLLAGFAVALLVVFQSPIQRLLDEARDVERTYGVALLPALLILTVMFVFHQHGKRREMKAQAAAAAVEAQQARARAQELEQLMLFGQSLARALSTEALREAVWRHLTTLSGGADAWVVLRNDAGWDRLTDAACVRWPAGAIERVADAAAGERRAQQVAEGLEIDGHVCFAMTAGSTVLGVIGMPIGGNDVIARRTLAAAAALLTVAIRNVQLFAEVHDHSIKDALTGCYNRAHTLEILDAELARSRRASNALSVVMFDVDHFKRINDQHGHLVGDSVLAAVGQRVRQVLRRSDVRCRYGGDEFLIVLPETSASGAARVGEWLRSEMEQIEVSPAGERVPVTISVGVATTVGAALPAAMLIDCADRALYLAKADGRNVVRALAEPAAAHTLASVIPAGV